MSRATHMRQCYDPVSPPDMRITMRLFLRVEYVRGVVNTGSGVRIRPLVDNSRVVNHQYTTTPQEGPSNQRADEPTNTIREVKSLRINSICDLST